jgi:hypothetical protein
MICKVVVFLFSRRVIINNYYIILSLLYIDSLCREKSREIEKRGIEKRREREQITPIIVSISPLLINNNTT